MLLRWIADRITHMKSWFAHHAIKAESEFDQVVSVILACQSSTHTTDFRDFRKHKKMRLVEDGLVRIPHKAIVDNLDSYSRRSRREC